MEPGIASSQALLACISYFASSLPSAAPGPAAGIGLPIADAKPTLPSGQGAPPPVPHCADWQHEEQGAGVVAVWLPRRCMALRLLDETGTQHRCMQVQLHSCQPWKTGKAQGPHPPQQHLWPRLMVRDLLGAWWHPLMMSRQAQLHPRRRAIIPVVSSPQMVRLCAG